MATRWNPCHISMQTVTVSLSILTGLSTKLTWSVCKRSWYSRKAVLWLWNKICLNQLGLFHTPLQAPSIWDVKQSIVNCMTTVSGNYLSMPYMCATLAQRHPGIILCMRPANERRYLNHRMRQIEINKTELYEYLELQVPQITRLCLLSQQNVVKLSQREMNFCGTHIYFLDC